MYSIVNASYSIVNAQWTYTSRHELGTLIHTVRVQVMVSLGDFLFPWVFGILADCVLGYTFEERNFCLNTSILPKP